MGISGSAYERLLKEYNDKQLAAQRDCVMRTLRIEEEIPELTIINSRIAQISVDMAVKRIRGIKEPGMEEFETEKSELSERRIGLLKSHGYSPSDLEPRYECSLCGDTGFVGNEKCACFKARLIDILYDQSNLKESLKEENFGAYSFKYYSSSPIRQGSADSPLTLAKKAFTTAQVFVRDFGRSADNLFITGTTGTGKTFLSKCIAKEILDQGYAVIYLSASKLFSILAEQAFSSSKSSDAGDILSCDLLMIDDLGTEYTNSFVQSAFFNCINERLLRKKHTVISTNLTIEQVRENYSERVFSRIAEKYRLIRLYGDDIRIKKRLEE